jgi:hypothetical protein
MGRPLKTSYGDVISAGQYNSRMLALPIVNSFEYNCHVLLVTIIVRKVYEQKYQWV